MYVKKCLLFILSRLKPGIYRHHEQQAFPLSNNEGYWKFYLTVNPVGKDTGSSVDERPWIQTPALQAMPVSSMSSYVHPAGYETHGEYLFSSWRYAPMNFLRIKNHRLRSQCTSARFFWCCPVPCR